MKTLLFERREETGIAVHLACLSFFLFRAPCLESWWSTRSIRLTHGSPAPTRAACVTLNLERRAGFGLQTGFPRRGKRRAPAKIFHSLNSHSRGHHRTSSPPARYSHSFRDWNSLSHRLAVFLRSRGCAHRCVPVRGIAKHERRKCRRLVRYRPKKKSRAILGGSFLPSFSKVSRNTALPRFLRSRSLPSQHASGCIIDADLPARCISDARGAINVSATLVVRFLETRSEGMRFFFVISKLSPEIKKFARSELNLLTLENNLWRDSRHSSYLRQRCGI